MLLENANQNHLTMSKNYDNEKYMVLSMLILGELFSEIC